MRLITAIVVSLALMGNALAQEALKPGDTISGKLRFFRQQHPNGSWISVYQISSDNPRQFAADDEFCDPKTPPKTFHLVVMNDKDKKARLDKLLGKTITVAAEDFSCSQTAWHVGDAVVFQWRFADPVKR